MILSGGLTFSGGLTVTPQPPPPSNKAIFGYGGSPGPTNLVSNTGVVANDVARVGLDRGAIAAAGYGTDKAIFGYGQYAGYYSVTNLVSNTGVVGNDVAGVGTARGQLAAATYGSDKAIFAYGGDPSTSVSNLVSNTGVVSNDVSGVGTARTQVGAAGYGTDKAIFGYGIFVAGNVIVTAMTNLVSNTGVVGNDVTGVGTGRFNVAAVTYGTDKAIFGYGQSGPPNYVPSSITNLVSNTGVVSTDTTGVGTARGYLAAAGYGVDTAIFGYGNAGPSMVSITNLISNTGVVASDTTGVGTARAGLGAATYGLS
jgi:hypothetical protein